MTYHLPRLALLAAATFAIAAPIVVASPVAAQRGQVNGSNVTYVRVNDGGSFAEITRGQWGQYEPNGKLWNRLEEVRRDATSVHLRDRSRRTEVILDLRTREVRGTEPGGSSWKRYYTITNIEADRGGRGRDDDRWARDRDRDDRWGRDHTRDIEVGPIWNQRDAETKCRDKARELRAEWTGQWRTTVQGRMSVCEMRMSAGGGGRGDWGRDRTRDIEVGPIWNQRDAETKCRDKAREMRGEWTGQWRTTVQGRMSVCEIRFR